MSETLYPVRLHSGPGSAVWTTRIAVLLGWAYTGPGTAIRQYAVCFIAAFLGTSTARAGEVGRIARTADYSGRIEAGTDVDARALAGTTIVEVRG